MGGVQQERIVLNEEVCGTEEKRASRRSRQGKLEKVRELLEKGEASKAQTLCADGLWEIPDIPILIIRRQRQFLILSLLEK